LEQGLKIVSLFDGISCGRVALARAGYAVSSYIAFEIDNFAQSISRYNYPDIEQHGDVQDADFSQYTGYDIVLGGSPCNRWSIAKANREVDKSGIGWELFMRFVKAVQQIKPRYFIYENVASMPQAIKLYITDELGVEPVLINSSSVSAQRRKRLYWTNINGITQPMDKGILLKDIIINEKAAREKTYYIDNIFQKGNNKKALDIGNVKRQKYNKPAYNKPDSKPIINSPICVGSLGAGSQGNRVYSVHGKTITLMANSGGRGHRVGLYKIDFPDGDYTIRKLLPIEAERCQTLPDDYTAFGINSKGKIKKISMTRRYKCIGNAWTVDVIAHILSHMN